MTEVVEGDLDVAVADISSPVAAPTGIVAGSVTARLVATTRQSPPLARADAVAHARQAETHWIVRQDG